MIGAVLAVSATGGCRRSEPAPPAWVEEDCALEIYDVADLLEPTPEPEPCLVQAGLAEPPTATGGAAAFLREVRLALGALPQGAELELHRGQLIAALPAGRQELLRGWLGSLRRAREPWVLLRARPLTLAEARQAVPRWAGQPLDLTPLEREEARFLARGAPVERSAPARAWACLPLPELAAHGLHLRLEPDPTRSSFRLSLVEVERSLATGLEVSSEGAVLLSVGEGAVLLEARWLSLLEVAAALREPQGPR